MTYSLKNLRYLASKLVGAAIKSLFPHAYVVGGEASDYGFFFDFILENETLDAQGLIHLEERVRGLLSSEISGKTTEMIRENAVAFFEHQHQPYLADQLAVSSDSLVQLIKIENFYDLCAVAFEGKFKDIGFIKLLEVEEREVEYPGLESLQVIRVTGTLFPSQRELKEFLKKIREAKKYTHQVLGPQLDLFHFDAQGLCYWSPRGLKLKNLICEKGKQLLQLRGCAFIETPENGAETKKQAHSAYLQLTKMPRAALAEQFVVASSAPSHQWLGLWRSSHYLKDEARFYCTPLNAKECLISSLQFITEIYTILGSGFNWQIGSDKIATKKQKIQNQSAVALLTEALQSCGIEFLQKEGNVPVATLYLTDCYGKPWAGPYVALEVDPLQPEKMVVVLSLWGSLERFIAWLLEHRHEAKMNVAEIRSTGTMSAERFVGIEELLQQLY